MVRMGGQDGNTRLRLATRLFTSATTGLAVGLLLASLIGKFVWLEMRVNVGHAIPVFMALSVLCTAWKRRTVRLAPFLLIEALALIVLLALYGFSLPALQIVPAALFRDGFHLGSASLQGIALFLLCFFGAVNVGWIGVVAILRRSNSKRPHPSTGQARFQNRRM